MGDIDHYWLSLPFIEGWVNERWLPYLKAIDETQTFLGITGELAEIGVFHGKLLIGLSHFLAHGGKATALDVFDDQAKNIDGAGVGNVDLLEKNIRLYGPEGIDWAIKKIDSSSLNLLDKVRLIDERGPFRLFSVDGCHTLEHTLNDLMTAEDCISDGGVVILDDVFQPHWPGVTEAVSVFCSRTPRIRPFLYCAHKLFLVGHGWHADFLRVCTERFGGELDAKVTTMFGSPAISVYP